MIWFQSCMFAAFVFSRGHSGLYDFESTSTLRISNYLSEVKRSVSQTHSTSLIYYALIPVNSLAGMGKSTCGDSEQRRAKPNQHIYQRWRKFGFALSYFLSAFFPPKLNINSFLGVNYILAIQRHVMAE